MTLVLGIDTGGTYTDAVILRDEIDVVASSKSLTTREDLAIGIGAAVHDVLTQSGISPLDIAMASLSTTLATNALVEGQGERVGLVYIGFRAGDLERHGLGDALRGDPVLEMAGGHSHAGYEVAAFNDKLLDDWLAGLKGVSAYAVASQFATRNPAHEKCAADLIRSRTSRPVSASHQLSAKLNGPKRALTAILNARLIGMIDRLIGRARATLRNLGISAPLMVVRGDGALISEDQAREKPIETILSGPAASIVGAQWMTGVENALVSDIGGTTTDISLLRNGHPMIDPQGAQVGPYRTMVEAVAMQTTGLGGDSEVHFVSEGLLGGLTLGPKRVLPVSLAAIKHGAVMHAALDAQLKTALPSENDGRFVCKIQTHDAGDLAERDAALFAKLSLDIQPMNAVIKSRLEAQALIRLVGRGLAQISALTPSDASHFLGYTSVWDRDAATKALQLFGRRRNGAGALIAQDAETMSQMIVDQLTHQTSTALLSTAFHEEDKKFFNSPKSLAAHPLMQQGLKGHKGLVKIDTGLNIPVVGLGASASCYYPAVGKRLNCQMILPVHSGVANAIGAVVGRITVRASGIVTAPSDGVFRLHLEDGPKDFTQETAALQCLERVLRGKAISAAKKSGAEDLQVTVHNDIRKAIIEASEMFVEANITVTATGRPRITTR